MDPTARPQVFEKHWQDQTRPLNGWTTLGAGEMTERIHAMAHKDPLPVVHGITQQRYRLLRERGVCSPCSV